MSNFVRRLGYQGPEWEELHEDYAKNGRIDTDAPVHATLAGVIDAPIETIWRLLADPATWAGWNPIFRGTDLPAALAVDEPFTWSLGGYPMKSRFAVVQEPTEVVWTDSAWGLRSVHRYTLRPAPQEGGVHVLAEESMAGPVMGLDYYTADKLLRDMNKRHEALKAAAQAE